MAKRFWGSDKPFKTEKEWDMAFESQCDVVSKTLNITMDQARVRMYALFASGILEQGDPSEPIIQMMIDDFLSNPAWIGQPKKFGEKQSS